MNSSQECEFFDAILNFDIPIIPDGKQFWMVRTKKGYFYNEFLSKKFVALAWNIIGEDTDFSPSARDSLKDEILIAYPKINRPSTVINKCCHFINDINIGDILVIPSKSSQYITFAEAGEYYEDHTKTAELERVVIDRIEKNDVDINDVSCPYKKRRRIKLLRTVKGEEITPSLYRAILNYHGISNLQEYAFPILNHLYNYYSYQKDVVLVYDIRKTTPIKSREFSHLVFGSTECLTSLIPEDMVSTKSSLSSPGHLVYQLRDAFMFFQENWKYFFALLVFFGGGKAFSFEIPGVIEVVKRLLSAPSEYKTVQLEAKEKKITVDKEELELLEKKVQVYERIRDSNIDLNALSGPLNYVAESAVTMRITPIELGDDHIIPSPDSTPSINSDDPNDEDAETIDQEV